MSAKKKKKKSVSKTAKKVAKKPAARAKTKPAPKKVKKPKKSASSSSAKRSPVRAVKAAPKPSPKPSPKPTAKPTAKPAPVEPKPFVPVAETPEPVASRNVPFPMVLVVLVGVLFYMADMYLADNSGVFYASVYYPHTKQPTASGGADPKQTYLNYCAACHQPTGKGSRQLNFPPLAGSEWVQTEGPDRIIRIVLNGLNGPIEVMGEQYNNVMLPWKDTMSDEQIAAVVTYIRSSWGNSASAVTAERVAEIRAETADRPNNWTAAELLKVPVGDP